MAAAHNNYVGEIKLEPHIIHACNVYIKPYTLQCTWRSSQA